MDKQLAGFFYAANLALKKVSHTEFVKFCRMIRLGYKLPTEKKLSGKLLDVVYEDEQLICAESLKFEMICMTLNGWLNVRKKNQSYVHAACTIKLASKYF